MKNLYILASFLLIVNIMFAGGTGKSQNAQEIWLLIAPVIIILVMLFSSYPNKVIRLRIEKRRLRKEEKLLEQNNEQIINHELIVSTQ